MQRYEKCQWNFHSINPDWITSDFYGWLTDIESEYFLIFPVMLTTIRDEFERIKNRKEKFQISVFSSSIQILQFYLFRFDELKNCESFEYLANKKPEIVFFKNLYKWYLCLSIPYLYVQINSTFSMTHLEKNHKTKNIFNIELPIFCFAWFKLALIISRFHKHEEKVNKKYFRKVKETSDQVPYIVHFFAQPVRSEHRVIS